MANSDVKSKIEEVKIENKEKTKKDEQLQKEDDGKGLNLNHKKVQKARSKQN